MRAHKDRPSGAGNPLLEPPTTAEVKQLWWFFDGSIMNPEPRHHLWQSWGFCPRHAWLHAAAEIELRGGRPFSTAILYEDLTARAASAAESHLPWELVARKLRSRTYCFTCDYTVMSAGDPTFHDRRDRVAKLERTRALLEDLDTVWRTRSCPVCLGGTGPICRPHLLASPHPPEDRAFLASTIRELARSLRVYVKSMTWQGPTASDEVKASWIEALGWFGSWEWPDALTHPAQSPKVPRQETT